MGIFDQLLGGRESMWFENGAAGARQGNFHGHVSSAGRRIAIVGTKLCRQGLAFFSPVRFAETELHIDFAVRSRIVKTRVRVERGEAVQSPQRVVHRYFCSFTGIAADDWDAVVRYVDDIPEPPLPFATAAPVLDEAFREFPSAVQNEIVELLVAKKRLTAPRPGTAPLIRVRAYMPRQLGEGRSVRDVSVHSRIVVDHRTQSHDTRFRVFSNGTVELVD
jgi:hypothetical protein